MFPNDLIDDERKARFNDEQLENKEFSIDVIDSDNMIEFTGDDFSTDDKELIFSKSPISFIENLIVDDCGEIIIFKSGQHLNAFEPILTDPGIVICFKEIHL